MLGEGKAERLQQGGRRVVQAIAEGQAEGELLAPSRVELTDEGDVALLRRVELPVEREIAGQVGPAVGGADVAAGTAHERDGGPHREPGAVLLGHQNLPASGLGDVPAVLPAAHVEVRREEREEPELRQHSLVALQPRTDEDARLVWIGNHLLDDAIAARPIGVDEPHPEGVLVDRLHAGLEVAALVMEEVLTVGHQVLQVADLRSIDGGVVDLVQDAGGDREPDAAASGVCRPDGVLGALGPSWCDPGGTERPPCRTNDRHSRLSLTRTGRGRARWGLRPGGAGDHRRDGATRAGSRSRCGRPGGPGPADPCSRP